MAGKEQDVVNSWRETDDSLRSGYQLHVMRLAAPWLYRQHGHKDFCELVYVLQGSLSQEINGEEVIQNEGSLVLIRDGDTHGLQGEAFVYINIMFPTAWFGRLEAYTGQPGTAQRFLSSLRPPSGTVPAGERETMRELCDALQAAHRQAQGRSLFACFLALVTARYLKTLSSTDMEPELPDWMRDTVNFIHKQHNDVPSLRAVIQYSCRCQEHVTRAFTQHLNMSPSRYLAKQRIDRAADLLMTTNFSVQEISERVGFENTSYFFRLFRKHYATTPIAYRRLHGPRSIRT